MNRKIRPVKQNTIGRVLVKPYLEDANSGGLIFVEENEVPENSDRGVVVAVGDTVKVDVKPGDDVIFTKFKPRMFKIEEEMYLFVPEDLINARIIRE